MKKKSRNLVLHKPSGEVITDLEFKGMLTTSMNDVYKLLECDNTNNAIQLMYKRVIQLSYKTLTKLENTVDEDNPRVAYPIATMAATLRDYLSDLQASMDRGQLAETIIDNILRPLFLEMASSVVVEISKIREEAKASMDKESFNDFNKNVLRLSQDRIVQVMQRSYEQAKLDSRKALQR